MNSLLVLKHLFVIDENSSTYFLLKVEGMGKISSQNLAVLLSEQCRGR